MCGGRDAILTTLDEDQRETRILNGCDGPAEPRARYAVLCAWCDGRGCAKCEGEDVPRRGHKLIRRCPASHLDAELTGYLRARAWTKRGASPYPGSVEDWPGRYVQFVEELEAEIARVQEAEREAEAARQKQR